MKYAALAAMLFAAPAHADKCSDMERLTEDYRAYVMGLYEVIEACEGERSEPCRIAQIVDSHAKKDGKPFGAGDLFLINLRIEACR